MCVEQILEETKKTDSLGSKIFSETETVFKAANQKIEKSRNLSSLHKIVEP